MRQAVSVSLGSSSRNKELVIDVGGVAVQIRREGTDGDLARARRRFAELDGTVDALGLGGCELYIRIGDRRYPLHAGLRLIQDVRVTPVADGGGLKQTLERRVFVRAPELAGIHFRKALILVGIDRFGLSEAVCEVTEEVVFADMYYGLGLPIPLHSLSAVCRVARWLLPVVGWMPIGLLYPTGAKQEVEKPRYTGLWKDIDLVAGDFLYIRRNLPARIDGLTVLTNSTTAADVELLKARGARRLIVTTPRFDGRSFGTNLLEATLNACAGHPLSPKELDVQIDRLDYRPHVLDFSS